jgi:hypothetical protein
MSMNTAGTFSKLANLRLTSDLPVRGGPLNSSGGNRKLFAEVNMLR